MRTVRTPEKEQALLDALRERPSFAAACRKARISRSLFYEWRKEDPAFAARVLAAREEGLDALEDALVARGLKNDTTAAIFLLKSHRREIYGDKLDINLQIRKKAEQLADELGIPADDLIQEAEAIAAGGLGRMVAAELKYRARCGHCDESLSPLAELLYGKCRNCNGTGWLTDLSEEDIAWFKEHDPERLEVVSG